MVQGLEVLGLGSYRFVGFLVLGFYSPGFTGFRDFRV